MTRASERAGDVPRVLSSCVIVDFAPAADAKARSTSSSHQGIEVGQMTCVLDYGSLIGSLAQNQAMSKATKWRCPARRTNLVQEAAQKLDFASILGLSSAAKHFPATRSRATPRHWSPVPNLIRQSGSLRSSLRLWKPCRDLHSTRIHRALATACSIDRHFCDAPAARATKPQKQRKPEVRMAFVTLTRAQTKDLLQSWLGTGQGSQ